MDSRFLVGMIFLMAILVADGTKSISSSEVLPSVWATLVDYYPQTPEFQGKIKAIKGALVLERFQNLYQFWLKKNHSALSQAKDNFLGYQYQRSGSTYELFWKNGYEPATMETIEKVLVLIHIQGKNPEYFSVLGDLLALNNAPELACRAYERAMDFGHPQKHRLQEMQEFAFRISGIKNVKSNIQRVKRTLKNELGVMAEWQKNKEGFFGDPPVWDRQLRVWKVPVKKGLARRQSMNKNQLIGGIVLSSISLIVGLLLLQAMEKRGLRKLCVPCAPTHDSHAAHH